MKYKAVEEKILYFDLPQTNDLKIKGILRGKLSSPIVIMVHGRPGSGNALLQYLGARYLYERGFSTLRLFMYDFESKTRNLVDCTLETNVSDFEAVISELRKRNLNQLFAIGHSYGGLTILKANVKLDGAVLWDPSHGLWWSENRDALFKDDFHETVINEYVIGRTGKGWVYSAAAQAYDKQLGDTSSLAAKDYPLKIISAGKGSLADLGKCYVNAAKEPKNHVVIKNADHGFEESDYIMLELFEETTEWLAKISSITK